MFMCCEIFYRGNTLTHTKKHIVSRGAGAGMGKPHTMGKTRRKSRKKKSIPTSSHAVITKSRIFPTPNPK